MDEFTERRRLSAPGSRGRPFAEGNPGRKRGSRNKATLVAEALLRDEGTVLLRKAIELAKAGDGPMLKFLLDRILPKERSVLVDLPPMKQASDAVDALEAITKAVSAGQITPNEAAALASLIESYARTIDARDLQSRLSKIEETLESFKELRGL
jgi:hypothetical protein